jgi:hypothetical protein
MNYRLLFLFLVVSVAAVVAAIIRFSVVAGGSKNGVKSSEGSKHCVWWLPVKRQTGFVVILVLLFLAAGPASSSMIVTYSVQAWSDVTAPPCLPNSGDSATCSVATVGAYSNTLTLAPGVPQSAELFPVIVTVPANWVYPAQMGSLLPLVDFTFTDTATGAQSIFQAPVTAEYGLQLPPEPSDFFVFGPANPDDFIELGSGGTAGVEFLQLRIAPAFSSAVAVPLGGTVTFDVTAVFTTPIPASEPGSAALLAASSLALCAASAMKRARSRRSRSFPTTHASATLGVNQSCSPHLRG